MNNISDLILFPAVYDKLYPYPNSSASMASTRLNLSIGDINTARENTYDQALSILTALDTLRITLANETNNTRIHR